MKISLNQVRKRYQDHWIFKNVTLTFENGKRYALLGANGSGKSTLLRLIAGMQQANKGTIVFQSKDKTIAPEKSYTAVSYCAPAMDLIEEMSLAEFLRFHFTFKKIRPGFTIDSIIAAINLQKSRNKFLHEFSSGMKQRVKLAQAFFSDTPILLLDEPCSNLDTQGVDMYSQWLDLYTIDRLVIIASNDEREYMGAHQIISVQDYHPSMP